MKIRFALIASTFALSLASVAQQTTAPTSSGTISPKGGTMPAASSSGAGQLPGTVNTAPATTTNTGTGNTNRTQPYTYQAPPKNNTASPLTQAPSNQTQTTQPIQNSTSVTNSTNPQRAPLTNPPSPTPGSTAPSTGTSGTAAPGTSTTPGSTR